jgi:hypothetical protein
VIVSVGDGVSVREEEGEEGNDPNERSNLACFLIDEDSLEVAELGVDDREFFRIPEVRVLEVLVELDNIEAERTMSGGSVGGMMRVSRRGDIVEKGYQSKLYKTVECQRQSSKKGK